MAETSNNDNMATVGIGIPANINDYPDMFAGMKDPQEVAAERAAEQEARRQEVISGIKRTRVANLVAWRSAADAARDKKNVDAERRRVSEALATRAEKFGSAEEIDDAALSQEEALNIVQSATFVRGGDITKVKDAKFLSENYSDGTFPVSLEQAAKIELRQQHGRSHTGGDIIKKIKQGGVEARDAINEWLYGRKDDAGSDWIVGNPNYRADYTADEMAAVIASIKLSRYLDAEVAASEGADQEVVRVARVLAANPSIPRAVQTKMLASLGLERSQQAADLAQNYRRRREVESGWFSGAIEGAKGIYRDWEGLAKMLSVAFSDDYYPYVAVMEAAPDDVDAKEWLKGLSEQEVEQKFGKSKKKVLEAFDNGEKVATEFLATLNAQDLSRANYADSSGQEAAEMFVRFLPDVVLTLIVAAIGGGEAAAGVGGTALVGGQAAAKAVAKKLAVKEMAKRLISAARKRAVKKLTTRKGLASLALTVATTADFGVPQGVDFARRAVEEKWNVSPTELIGGAAVVTAVTGGIEKIQWELLTGAAGRALGVKFGGRTLFQQLSSAHRRSGIERLARLMLGSAATLPAELLSESIEEALQEAVGHLTPAALGITDVNGKSVFSMSDMANGILENAIGAAAVTPWMIVPFRALSTARAALSRIRASDGSKKTKSILTVEQGVLNALAEADAIAQAMAAGKGQLDVSAKELLQIAQIADPKEREKVYKEKGWDSRQRERAEIVAEYAQNSIRYKQRLDEAAKKKSGDAGQQRRTKGAKTVTTVVNNNNGENTGGKKNTGAKGTVTERPTEELSESDMQKETSAAIVRMKELREKRKELEKKKAEVKKTVLEYGNKENAAMNRGDELTYEEQRKYDEAAAELLALNTQLKNLTEERKKLISRVTAIKAERSRRAALVDSMTTDAKLMYNSDIDKAVADIEKRLAEINGRIQEKAKKGEGIAPSLQAEQRLLAVRRAELKAERERRAAELKSKKTGDLKKRLDEVEERMTDMAEANPVSMSAKEDAEWAKLAIERESIIEELQRRKTRKNVKQDKKDLEDAKEALKTLANVEESLVELTKFVLSHMGIDAQGMYGGVVANRLAGMVKHGSTIEARRKAATATIVRYFCGKDAFDALFGTEAAMKKNIGLWRAFAVVMPQLLDLGLTKDGGKDYGIIDELNVAIRLFAFGKDKVKFKTPEDVSKLEFISPENTRGEFHPETVEELANILSYAIENSQPEVLQNVLAVYATKAFSFAFVNMHESKAAMLRDAFDAEKKAAEERKKQQQEEEDAETGEEAGDDDDDDDSGDGEGEGEGGTQTKTSPTIEAIFEAAKNGAKWAYRIVSRSFIFGGYYSFSRIPFGDSMLGSAGVLGIMPYNLLGNKSRLIASHPNLIRAFGAHAMAMGGAVYDLFGGAAAWTTFLAENGLLPKGSVLNEYSESRWNALSKLINGDQDKIAARLADAATRFYASEEYAQIIKAQADKRHMDNATANRMAARWFSDELSGLHGATGYIDENGHLAHTEEVAALYILIQNFSIEPVDFVAKDGKGTYADSKGGQKLWDYRGYLAKKNERFTTIDGAKAFVTEFANKFKGKDVYVLRGDAIAKITGEKEEFNNGEIPPIKAGSVIFLDPPYMGTKGYSQDKTSSGYENPAHFEAEMNKVIDYLVQHGLMNNVTLVITNQFEASVDRSNKTAEKAANKRIETIQKIATRATYEHTENGQVYHIPAMAVGIGSRSDRDVHRGSKEVGEEELKKRGGHGAEGVAKHVVLNEVMMVSDGCAHLMTPSAFEVEFVCKEHPELTAEEAVQIIERARKAQYAQAIEEVAATKEGEEGAKLREKKQELLDKADEQRKTRTSRALRNYGARATTRASRGLLSQFIRKVAGWLRGTAIVVLSDDEFERRVATVQNGRASLAEYYIGPHRPLVAYSLHAGQKKFTAFDLSFAYSGEGSMAYGRGVYLSLSPHTHQGYLKSAIDRARRKPSGDAIIGVVNEFYKNSRFVANSGPLLDAMVAAEKKLREAIARDYVMRDGRTFREAASPIPYQREQDLSFLELDIICAFMSSAKSSDAYNVATRLVLDSLPTSRYQMGSVYETLPEEMVYDAFSNVFYANPLVWRDFGTPVRDLMLSISGVNDMIRAIQKTEPKLTSGELNSTATKVGASADIHSALVEYLRAANMFFGNLQDINTEAYLAATGSSVSSAYSYVVEVDLGINGDNLLDWNTELTDKDAERINKALDEIIAQGGIKNVSLNDAKFIKYLVGKSGFRPKLSSVFNQVVDREGKTVPTVLTRAGFVGHTHSVGQAHGGRIRNFKKLLKSIEKRGGVDTISSAPFNLIVYEEAAANIIRRRQATPSNAAKMNAPKKLGPRARFLRGHDGEIIGMFDSDTGEVMVKEGADLTVVAHELGWHAMFAWARKNAPELYDKLVEVARNAPEEIKQSIRERYGDISEEEFIDECGAAMFESAARAPIEKWIDSVQDKGLKAKLKAWWKAFKTAIMQVWCKMRGNYDTYFTADGKTKVDINKILSKESPAEVIKAIAEAFVDGQILAEAQREMTDGYESGRDSTSGEGTRFARARKPKPMSDVRDKAARDATRGRGKELMPEDRPVATYRTLVRDAVEVMFAAMMKHGIELNDGDNSLGDRAREVVEQAFPDEGSYFYDDVLNAARQSAQEAFRRKTQLGLDLTKSVQELAEDIHKAVAGNAAYEANSVVMSTMAAIRDLQSDAEVVAQAKERLRHRSELRKQGRLGKTKARTRRQLADMGVEAFSPRQEQELGEDGAPVYWADKVAEAIKAYFPRKGIALGTLRKTLYAEYNRAARLLNPKTMKKAGTLLAELNAANSWDDVLFAARELENLLRGGAVKESAESIAKKIKVLVSRYKSVSRTKIEGERKALGLDEVFFYTFKRAAFASGKRKMSIEDVDAEINELTAKLAPSTEAANEKGVGAVGEWGRSPAGEEALQQRAALGLAREFLSAQQTGDIEALARIQGVLLARQTEGKKTLNEKKKEQSDAAENDADALAKAIYVEGRNKAGAHEGSLLNTLGGLFTGTLSWKQQLEDAIRFATGEVKAKAQAVIEKLNKAVADADYKAAQINQRNNQWLSDTLVDIWGTGAEGKDASARAHEASKIMSTLSAPSEEYARFSADGKTPLSYAQILQLYASLRQHDVQRPFDGLEELPPDAQRAKVAEMGEGARRLWARLQQLDELQEAVGEKGERYLDACAQKYLEDAEELDEVAMDITGVPLSLQNADYYPICRDFERVMLNSPSGGLGYVPTIMTPRTSNKLDLDEQADAFSMWRRRSADTAHFIAFGRLHMHLGKVFGNEQFSDALRRTQGKTRTGQLVNHTRAILSPQMMGSGLYDRTVGAMGWMASIAAHAALGMNILSMIRQVTSVPAFAFTNGMTAGETILASLKGAFTAGGWERMKKIAASDGFRERYGTGEFDAQMSILAAKGGSAMLRRAFRYYMSTNRFGDRVPILLVGQAILAAKTQELQGQINPETGEPFTAEEAETEGMKAVWELADKSQQATRTANKGSWQLNPVGRFIMQFQTATSQFAAAEVLAIRQCAANPSWENKRHLAHVVLTNHVLLPCAYTLAGTLFQALTGGYDDDDDWGKEVFWDFVKAILLGPSAGIFLLGSIITSLVTDRRMRAGQAPSSEILSQSLNVVRHAGHGDFGKAIDDIVDAVPLTREGRDFCEHWFDADLTAGE